MKNCKHCNKDITELSKSNQKNHVRWCDSNPKRNTWNKQKQSIDTYGLLKEFSVNCVNCEKNFFVKEREKLFPQKKKYFCSRSCANSVGGRTKANKYGIVQYVTIAKKFHQPRCVVCNEDQVLDVHHIDENRNNNSANNLVFLCPNHHAALHRLKDDTVKLKIKNYIDNGEWDC